MITFEKKCQNNFYHDEWTISITLFALTNPEQPSSDTTHWKEAYLINFKLKNYLNENNNKK